MEIEDLVHVDGVPWHEAPRPRLLHRCRVQTSAQVDERLFERCPCGAIRIDGGTWLERNSRGRTTL